MEKITSHTNPKIKNVQKLHKANERQKQNLFLIEGCKEILLALENQYQLHSLFVCPELFKDDYNALTRKANLTNVFEITRELFSKIAYRESSDGLLAVAWQKELQLKEIKLSANPLIIVLESVEKPGNLGAILRTSDAVHADAVIIADPHTDMFNPNVIRSSVGCFFTTKMAKCSNQEALDWLRSNQIKTYAAALNNRAKPYHRLEYLQPAAFIMGTEADGLTDFWLKNSDEIVIIPMLGQNDSLNVSTATAVLAFEAMRQREFRF